MDIPRHEGNPAAYGYEIGDRVEISPSCDLWMMGARYGEIRNIGRKYIHIAMDRTGRVHKFYPSLIQRKV